MSLTEWTEQQQCAIAHEEGNVLVSAAAGSGKTAVLTERILRLIRQGAGVESFLVVTFTQAAAREMKARILSGLLETLSSGDSREQQLASQALAHMESAQISTLHAFCRQVLQRHFHEARLDSAFGVLESAEASVMQLDVIDAVFDECYEAKDGAFLVLEEVFGGSGALGEAVLQLWQVMQAHPDPEAFLTRAETAYCDGGEGLAPALEVLLKQARRQLRLAVEALSNARALADEPKAAAVVDEELSVLRSLEDTARRKGYGAFVEHVRQVNMLTLRWPKDTDEGVKAAVAKRRDVAKNTLRSLKAAFSRTPEEEQTRIRAMALHVAELCRLVREFDARFAQAKEERNAIDYADMEHMALRVLRNGEIAAEYRERFAYIFVDEYQDSNAMQEALIDAIRRDGNLFLVGDIKQSIYRFRLADPLLFVDKTQSFTGTQGRGGGKRIDLPHNFRSAGPVVDAVNRVFSRLMSRELGDIDYDQSAALIAAREGEAQRVEWLICVQDAQAEDEEEEKSADMPKSAEAEAGEAARRIRQLVGQTLGGRKIAYGDIAILLRVTKHVAGVYARTLAQAGIPAVTETGGGYFEAREVYAMLQLLRVIDNRRQDIPLLDVMRTFFGFTLDELVALRGSGETLYDDVVSYAQGLAENEARIPVDGELAQKCQNLADTLAAWKQDARLLRLDALVEHLLAQTGYALRVGALPGGEGRKANLYALQARARAYAQGAGSNLQGFLRFIERMQASGADFSEAAGSAADAVRILSVHRSKGLEFPVVVFGGLGRKFRRETGTLAIHKTLGLGLPCVDLERRIKGDTLLRRAIREAAYREGLSEELRILYVGMTRARDKLILLGSVKGDVGEKIRLLRYSEAGCLNDWLMQALGETDAMKSALSHGKGQSTGLEVRVVRPTPPDAMEETDWGEVLRQALADADTSWVEQRLAFRYPWPAAANVPSKAGASMLAQSDELQAQPRFMQGASGAAERGTLTHAVLQWLDLRAPLDREGLRAQLDALASEGKLHASQAELVDVKLLQRFFQSELGRAMIGSDEVRREVRFQLSVNASRLREGAEGDVLLQGVIDCCFLKRGEWVLLDYKTDSVFGDAGKAAEAYFPQVSVYREALEKLTQRRVAEAYVVFLRPGEAIPVPGDGGVI